MVADASDVPFWREYRSLGGPAELGYPLSARFVEGGNVYQALQAGILRRSAATELVDLHPVLLAMSELGLDEWLLQWGVPATAEALRADPNLPLDTRLAWLTHPALRAVYLDGGDEDGQAPLRAAHGRAGAVRALPRPALRAGGAAAVAGPACRASRRRERSRPSRWVSCCGRPA